MTKDTSKRRRIDPKDKRRFTSRCSFMEFKKTFVECSEEVQAAFKETPFKWFAEFDFPTRDPEFYAQVLNLYFPEKSSFQIAGTMLELTVDHVAKITGLEKEGLDVCVRKRKKLPPSLFRMTYFDKREPNVSLARAALRNLRKREDPDMVDRVRRDDQLRLLILVLFGSFLFPHGDHAIYPGLFEYAEDFPNLKKYSWAKAVHTLLHQGLTDMVKKKSGLGSLGYLKGCSSLLSVWACEVLDIATPGEDGTFPTVGRWCYTTRISTLLKENKLELLSLKPTSIKKKDHQTRAMAEKQIVQAVSVVIPTVRHAEVSCRESHASMSSERELLDARMECNKYERLWLEQQRENLQLRETIETNKQENENLKDSIKEWEKKFNEMVCENQDNRTKVLNLQAENKIIRDKILRECSQGSSPSFQLPKLELAIHNHLKEPSHLLNI